MYHKCNITLGITLVVKILPQHYFQSYFELSKCSLALLLIIIIAVNCVIGKIIFIIIIISNCLPHQSSIPTLLNMPFIGIIIQLSTLPIDIVFLIYCCPCAKTTKYIYFFMCHPHIPSRIYKMNTVFIL